MSKQFINGKILKNPNFYKNLLILLSFLPFVSSSIDSGFYTGKQTQTVDDVSVIQVLSHEMV